MTTSIAEQLSQLPDQPGVYQYFNETGDLLYVGKAKNLAKRVRSYWQKTQHSPWTEMLVAEVTEIKTTEVSTELEALFLENSLVKSLRPKYNIQLKDDKTFPFLRISSDPFPKFSITRHVKQDGSKYFGPYFSATYLRSLLKLLQELYGIKTAEERSYESRSRVPQQIGLGARNLDNPEAYASNVQAAIHFLSQPQPQMERTVREAMHEASIKEEFEQAAILRNKLQAIQQLRSTQSLFGTDQEVRDYVGIATAGKLSVAYILFERQGKITNNRHFVFELPPALHDDERTSYILEFLYLRGLTTPKEIIVSKEPAGRLLLQQGLSEQSGKKLTIHAPQRGDKLKRLTTATDNAEHQLRLELNRKQRREHGAADLAHILGIGTIPRRIEAFDISNLGATNIVGASIVFIDGHPAKNEYRKYIINTPEGQDDFASMRELVYRRASNRDRPLPDLLLIDGGKGQLSAARDALALAKQSVSIFSLAKKEELIYVPGKSEPITLPHDSDALLFITAIRDEVHRFVIQFHRKKRSKRLLG